MTTFVFPGQGSQQKGMGRALFGKFPDIVAIVDRVLGYSIEDLCLTDAEGRLGETAYTQPALFVVNALTYFHKIGETGRRPDFVAGHSLGEYNALLAAEAFDFETGLRLVQKRGALMGRVRGGGMAAVVGLTEAAIEKVLADSGLQTLDIANRNTPSQFVLSGRTEDLEKAKPALEAAGARMVVPLRVSAPFHSRYMGEAREEFTGFLKTLRFAAPRIPVIANVLARPYPAAGVADLLGEQITSSVRWTDTIRYLLARGETEFAEIGPGTVLTGLIQKIRNEAEPLVLNEEPSVSPEAPIAPHVAAETGTPTRSADSEREHPAYRRHGVYVVIGGAGGIGTIWSEYVIRNYAAQVIWLGRREKNMEIEASIERLAQLGPRPLYISADATDRESLQRAHDQIRRIHPVIHGLVHAAIVLRDQSLAKMDEDTFRAGLSAKVDVSVRMTQVFRGEPLDFVLFFSSIAAFGKAPGQSNYSAGCTFKDAFAQRLAADLPCPVKVMNWGYWGSVGVTATPAYRQRMAQQGIGSIEAPEGMGAIETLFEHPVQQLAMIEVTKPLTMPGMHAEEALDASKWAAPSLLMAAVTQAAATLPPAASSLQERHQIDVMLHPLLWAQLRTLLPAGQNEFTLDVAMSAAGILPLYGAWMAEAAAALCRAGILRQDGARFSVVPEGAQRAASAWVDWDALKATSPSSTGYFPLVEATLRALPEILTGRRRATDVIFPNLSMDLVAAVYKDNLVADYFNGVLADAVADYCKACVQQDPPVRLRLLEVGAGTGGTTNVLLPRLSEVATAIGEYRYTDLSQAFLLHGERTYGPGRPYLKFSTFNVESDPESQGLELGAYDVVVAANVLHATGRIRPAVRHAKALLKPNGLLLLNEISSNSLFSHLTFGLLQGWWLYRDPKLRIEGSPVLAPETWKRVLLDEGFRAVEFPAAAAHDFGQQIVVAESDGQIRRSVQNPHPKPSMTPVASTFVAAEAASSVPPAPVPEVAAAATAGATSTPLPRASSALRDKAREYFRRTIGEALKIPSHKIATTEPLDTYGVDSINIVQLTEGLSLELGEIESTLFFEYPTIDAVVDHFLQTRHERLARMFGEATAAPQPPVPAPVATRPDAGAEVPVVATRFQPRRPPEGAPRELPSSEAAPDANRSAREPIAIVGLSGRYPQAANVDEFWEILKNGRNCASEIPRDRWDWEKYFDPERGKLWTTYTRWGGFLADVDKFDPLFFRLSPLEARRMDPQERVFLETAYSSIEDAGYTPRSLATSRRVGVFVGVMNSTYLSQPSHWSIANRVSYLFDFQGPSLAVDTACSSSLTAIHLAVESLHSGSSDCAIAGGVNLILDPVHYFGLCVPRLLSSGEECRPFGEGADGFVDAEGVGAVVLKPLSKAVQDGDHIYGVLRGTAINHGGKSSGYTVPNPNAQARLIVDAFQDAGVSPRAVSYIEAQANGTMLGDPLEIAGLRRAFESETPDKGFCAIGSVKSNIGHCESASGIAGLTKVLLQLRHGLLAPSIHADPLNPKIRFQDTPFRVQHELGAWQAPVLAVDGVPRQYPRIAGISSFGAGGANAHVIVEEWVETRERKATGGPSLMVLSAKNAAALERVLRGLRDFLKQARAQQTSLPLEDIAYTLQVGRVALEERVAILASSTEELEEKLSRILEGTEELEGVFRGRPKTSADVAAFFVGDEELTEAVEKWLQRGKLSKLIELWLLGVEIDWNRSVKSGTARRVSLPTYPFARERYWLEESERRRPVEKPLNADTAAAPVPIEPDASTVPLETAVLGQSLPGEALDDRVRRVVSQTFREVLTLDDKHALNLDDSFADYGLDSVTGMQLIERINRTLLIDVDVSRLFDYATVERLAAHIVSEHREQLEGRAEPPASPEVVSVQRAQESPVGSPEVQETPLAAASRSATAKAVLRKEPIAIIGLSGRFPKSPDVETLWQHLAAGDDMIDAINRWDLKAAYEAEAIPDQYRSFDGGLVDDIDKFDPLFFSIPAIEATYMDPQQRLFLQEAWHAMEDAGYAGQSADGLRCGVYVGCGNGDYFNLFDGKMPAQAFWGNAASVVPARIAYYMNLRGPAIPVDTACSSSLVALHLACQGLWGGETDMALAGGVYVQSTPTFFVLSTRAGMLSPTGRCHTFDQAADGFAMGEGVGAFVLKRLSDAIAAGDHIHGVIRGSGMNQDGRTNGITAPSAKAQETLELEVYESFGVNPADIRMVEAHGTGTRLGDPIEVDALTRAFRRHTDRKQFCALGSIKASMGHATMAAGVAGMMRVLLALKHRQIPASLHLSRHNDKIRFEDSPFYVNTVLEPWDVPEGRTRLAAISSFGFSGTNAHLVVEEAPPSVRQHAALPAFPVVLSARTPAQLRQQAGRLSNFCDQQPETDLGDMSFTLLVGRKHMSHRLAVVARTVGDLRAKLDAWAQTGNASDVRLGDLGQTIRRDQPTLKRYADECLERLAGASDLKRFEDDLAVVADLYVQGGSLDFARLFASGGYGRISLPVYPFAEERYWVAPKAQKQAAAPAASAESHVADAVGHATAPAVAPEVPEEKRKAPFSDDRRPAASVVSDESWVGCVALLPRWDPAPLERLSSPLTSSRVLVIGASERDIAQLRRSLPSAVFMTTGPDDSVDVLKREIERPGPIEHLLWIAPKPLTGVSSDSPARAIRAAFRTIKALLGLGYAQRRLQWTIVTRGAVPVLSGETPVADHAGVHGLFGSMAQEYLNWSVRLADIEDGTEIPVADLLTMRADPRGVPRAFRQGRWYRRVMLPCRNMPQGNAPYRDGGVFVVVGGAGGIGEIWSEFVIRNYHAQVVWLGRRAEDEVIRAKRARLAQLGPAPVYLSADASRVSELERAYSAIRRQFPAIHGVVHSAVGAFDQRLEEMTEEHFARGLSAKVETAVAMAQVFRNEPLDFFLFQSSIESFATSHGKASYTAGCAFADAFARQLSSQTAARVKVMNWGYWGDVGAGASMPESVKKRMALTGVGALEPEEGMQALSQLMAGPFDQLVLHKATRPIPNELFGTADWMNGTVRMSGGVTLQSSRDEAPEPLVAPAPATASPTVEALKRIVSRVTQVAPENLAMQMSWSELGLDSILSMQVLEEIESEFGLRVYPNELLERDTLEKLLVYIAEEVEKLRGAGAGRIPTGFAEGAGLAPARTPTAVIEAELPAARRAASPENAGTAVALKRIISEVTQVGTENLALHLSWTELGLDSILSMQILERIEAEFGLRVYPNELVEHDTLDKLVAYLTDEIAKLGTASPSAPPVAVVTPTVERQPLVVSRPAPVAPRAPRTELKQPLLFILGTPRSGSTLLRVMLAGHEQLFSPPELHLLAFDNFAERTATLKATRQQFVEEGLIKTLCELQGVSAEEARVTTAAWTAAGTPIKDVYSELRALCEAKVLVDKSPSYASDLEILRKAERLEANPFYIHLVRHPLAVMESFVRNRFDKLLSVTGDAWAFAAQLWQQYNENIERFLQEIPQGRWMRLRYEDLVTQPEATMKELFARMDMPFDPRVLDPYEGERMTGGLHAVSMPLSDPNFRKHKRIESELGSAWENHLERKTALSEAALRLAETYGYRFVREARHALLPAQEAFLRRFGDNPVWNIDQFVRLKLDRPIDLVRLRACLHHLVARHASLRNAFRQEGGTWIQIEGDTYTVPLFSVDARRLDGEGISLLAASLRSELHGFADGRGRVNLACGVVHHGSWEYQIILVAHHLAADGISVHQLQQELLAAYRSPNFPELRPRPDERVYDYLSELERLLTPSVLAAQRDFWKAHIPQARHSLPMDKPAVGGPHLVATETEYHFRVPMAILGWSEGRSKRDFFLYLNAALYRCLAQWSGSEEIAVAHRLHRRTIDSPLDMRDAVGWFAGDVPLLMRVPSEQSVRDLATAFGRQFAAIPMGGVAYEVLSNRGELPECHAVCPVRLNYYPAFLSNGAEDGEVGFWKYESSSHERLYALELIVAPGRRDGLFILRYSMECFSAEAIQVMANRLIRAFTE